MPPSSSIRYRWLFLGRSHMCLLATDQLLINISTFLLVRSHRTEPGKELLYTLFILLLTAGCAKGNSWSNSQFRSMKMALFTLTSWLMPSTVLVIKLPRYLALLTHGRGVSQRIRGAGDQVSGFLLKTIPFVLLFSGRISVLNAILYSSANFSAIRHCHYNKMAYDKIYSIFFACSQICLILFPF